MMRRCARAGIFGTIVLLGLASLPVAAQMLSNSVFKVQIGNNGEISSLQLTADAFPTNYVMNATNARGQATADHAWVGELMFSYRLDGGAWATALTNQSSDVRKIAQGDGAITVSYESSANANGIQKLKLVETYALAPDNLTWTITVTNTTAQMMEIGDFGLPLPFNEYWFARDVIYETRTVYHSFTGQNSSYITASRPSGVGPFLLMIPDATTGAGFEYMDNWRDEEHPGSAWAAEGGDPKWSSGLDVFYIHSNVIKSTHRGYLPNTSLMLAPNESKTYAFKFFQVASHEAVKDRLFSEGLIDVSVVPSMMFATNMTAKIDLHTSKPIVSITPQYPAETSIMPLDGAPADHHIYQVTLAHLGQNDLVVSYGAGELTTLQFYALEPIDVAVQRHATFMVDKTVSASGPLTKVFDDWMMDAKAPRGKTGSWGWGDDWGWTHAQFLAEKNAQSPVASEVAALEEFLGAAWGSHIDSAGAVNNWWCGMPAESGCMYDRAFAYPHVFNTFFSMYKVAHLYPKLITYKQPADTYLMRAYSILHTLYSGHGEAGTGYMGEQTLPDIIRALTEEKHTTEAAFVTNIVSSLYKAFKGSPYPYGSEYSYDNTGEEAVYMAAKYNKDTAVLEKVNTKTRACRGHQPVWYYYADPVTLNGENWWQFQYSASLIGYCMDDWLRSNSKQPELDERLSYAAKIANISAINSGQIDAAPENLGAVSWTYQAMKGDVYVGSAEDGKLHTPGVANNTLHNGWRQMSGEADLGLFGALRILSADVAVDPVFGLYGYGCEVRAAASCYVIKPLDGVFKRLNLITEKLYLELERDRYDAATLSTTNDFVALTLQNQTMDAHMTKLTIAGLAPATYPVTVDGVSAGMLTATAGQAAVVMLPVAATPTALVQIGQGCQNLPAATGGAGAGGTVRGVGPQAGTGATATGGATAPGQVPTGAGGRVSGAGGLQSVSGDSGGAGVPGSGGAAGAADAGKSSGCSCQVPGRGPAAPGSRSPWLLAITVVALAIVRRHRGMRAG